jgi:hypothetical protein
MKMNSLVPAFFAKTLSIPFAFQRNAITKPTALPHSDSCPSEGKATKSPCLNCQPANMLWQAGIQIQLGLEIGQQLSEKLNTSIKFPSSLINLHMKLLTCNASKTLGEESDTRFSFANTANSTNCLCSAALGSFNFFNEDRALEI